MALDDKVGVKILMERPFMDRLGLCLVGKEMRKNLDFSEGERFPGGGQMIGANLSC